MLNRVTTLVHLLLLGLDDELFDELLSGFGPVFAVLLLLLIPRCFPFEETSSSEV